MTETEEVIVLDDSKYFLILLLSLEIKDSEAPAYLHMRGLKGQECLGHCWQQLDGSWDARLNVIYDDATNSDSLLIGSFDHRVDAIIHLWQRRKQAFSI
ncbi:hypothetical protein [Comamonas sp.]|uniref:hypothetical protein n=1 Tax=Comamonas sp. TaxID=34028 RepID=UPI00258C4992|nr:hypothetical protein [Comamonas sp.]